MGTVFTSGNYQLIDNLNENVIYNKNIDIDTSLPIICKPIVHPNSGKMMGVLQAINP